MRRRCTRPTPAFRWSRPSTSRGKPPTSCCWSASLDVIRRGIEEGRKTFANTLKYILITTSANLGNMVSMAAASLFLPFLPLTAGQILLNNFLSDIPAIGIADDSVDPELVDRPRRWDIRFIGRFMVHVRRLELGLRLSHLRRCSWRLPRDVADVPHGLVRRVAAHRAGHRAGRAHAAAVLSQPARHAAARVDGRPDCGSPFAIPYLPFASVFGFVRLPGALLAIIWHHRALRRRDGAPEAMVLSLAAPTPGDAGHHGPYRELKNRFRAIGRLYFERGIGPRVVFFEKDIGRRMDRVRKKATAWHRHGNRDGSVATRLGGDTGEAQLTELRLTPIDSARTSSDTGHPSCARVNSSSRLVHSLRGISIVCIPCSEACGMPGILPSQMQRIIWRLENLCTRLWPD